MTYTSDIDIGDVGSWFLSLTKKQFRAKNSNVRRSLFSMQSKSALEEKIQAGCSDSCLGLVEVSQLCCVDSGNKLQRQKKGLWRPV